MSVGDDVADRSLLELFRGEVEGQLGSLSERLLALEQHADGASDLEALMRAAHSIKGAARMVDVEPVIKLAHAMEDCFVVAQRREIVIDAHAVDILLRAADMIARAAGTRPVDPTDDVAAMVDAVAALRRPGGTAAGQPATATSAPSTSAAAAPPPIQAKSDAPIPPSASSQGPAPQVQPGDRPAPPAPGDETGAAARVVRVSATRMDKILGLAGEALVESRGFWRQIAGVRRLKDRTHAVARQLDQLAAVLEERQSDAYCRSLLQDIGREMEGCRQMVAGHMEGLTDFAYRSGDLAEHLHNELINGRMRPFADGIEGLQRLVRDLARDLGKEAVLEIVGLNTAVDREVLAKVKTPLNHLLRNAVDHGLETAAERAAAGKPVQGRIRLEARHHAGMLTITVEDDGHGIDLERLRERVVSKGLVNAAMARQLRDDELLEFIFLPGFSTRDTITEISGRGVGMDVVQDMVREIRGAVTATTRAGKGTRIHLQLPLTLSVIRALLVEVNGDCYAVPLTRIDHTLRAARADVEVLEDRQYITLDGGQHIGLVVAAQIFSDEQGEAPQDPLNVVVVSDRNCRYGIVVDRFLGEREFAVRVLDPRLGKLKDISAAALLDDGRPVLIVDVDDMVRSIDKVVGEDRLRKVRPDAGAEATRPRILVVDDSITVREVERKLLLASGYDVEVAVDGMDGWNAVRGGGFALVITDVDMPRMDGIELVSLIKQDADLKDTPVMIVSYKDREADRHRGLEAGADYYLTKGSFHDDTLREAVVDLIGGP